MRGHLLAVLSHVWIGRFNVSDDSLIRTETFPRAHEASHPPAITLTPLSGNKAARNVSWG